MSPNPVFIPAFHWARMTWLHSKSQLHEEMAKHPINRSGSRDRENQGTLPSQERQLRWAFVGVGHHRGWVQMSTPGPTRNLMCGYSRKGPDSKSCLFINQRLWTANSIFIYGQPPYTRKSNEGANDTPNNSQSIIKTYEWTTLLIMNSYKMLGVKFYLRSARKKLHIIPKIMFMRWVELEQKFSRSGKIYLQ